VPVGTIKMQKRLQGGEALEAVGAAALEAVGAAALRPGAAAAAVVCLFLKLILSAANTGKQVPV
jgi:hypothetical protein